VEDQFAEGAQDQEGEEAADGVGDDQGRAGGVEPAAGAEEQAGADRAADGDHLDLPRLEALVVALVLGMKKVFGGVCLGRDRMVSDRRVRGGALWGIGHGGSFGYRFWGVELAGTTC
jgi:hypothetical protein